MVMKTASEWEVRLTKSLEASKIPERMYGGIIRYIITSIHPGDFLCAIITNNLKGAFTTADDENQLIVRDYVQWFYNHAPGSCWGSKEAMSNWTGTNKGGG
jgi:hypothetical protein